jgi:AGZA family xanthine/uracil permease-like MFS transporter
VVTETDVTTWLERTFHLRDHGTTVRTEVLAGTTTFLTMVYIVFVNPMILSGAGMDFGAVLTATCLAAGLATWVMGFAANYPIAMAPGMGENVFFVTAVVAMGLSWQAALAAVFVSGVVFVALNFFRLREMVLHAIPASLKMAIAAGIGLFIAWLGLKNAGVVVAGADAFALGNLAAPPTILALVGTALTVGLMALRVRGAILIGILASGLAALATGMIVWQGFVAPPPSLAPTFLALDLAAIASLDVLPIVLIFLFMAVFDAIGTLVAVGEQAGLMVDGKLPRAGRALTADASGTVVGALLGTSTVTAYIESATGVEEGGRTGLANVVTGALFLVVLFFSPVVHMIGEGVAVEGVGVLNPITAPALIVVGCLMARCVTRIAWDDLTEAFPAFLILAGIPFFRSIADGIAFGFIAYPALKLLAGRPREASPLVYGLGAVLLARYLFL